MTLVVGIRYEILSDFDDEFSYCLGATKQFESGFYSKLLYGTAFRIPSYRKYLDVLAYNDDL
ncbi:hypothetical protein [Candidatus Parabeggiatoa sp. HSG14]|uniref:hypothetical protein n=1 Tax=Candidatus Parabeggiatoa sp. HSG14 TaxID=3055593 RepID=UPI0025A69315|nr:hypothetical protein [Thiotrichales bacterium HSG14]